MRRERELTRRRRIESVLYGGMFKGGKKGIIYLYQKSVVTHLDLIKERHDAFDTCISK